MQLIIPLGQRQIVEIGTKEPLLFVPLEKATKSENDGDHPASHYLYVPDSSKPSTWKLPYKNSDGSIDWGRVGGAWAALHGGFRGNKAKVSNKEALISKLRSVYKSGGKVPPDERGDDKSLDAGPLEVGDMTTVDTKSAVGKLRMKHAGERSMLDEKHRQERGALYKKHTSEMEKAMPSKSETQSGMAEAVSGYNY